MLTTESKEHSRLYLHYRKGERKERKEEEKNQINVRKCGEPVK